MRFGPLGKRKNQAITRTLYSLLLLQPYESWWPYLRNPNLLGCVHCWSGAMGQKKITVAECEYGQRELVSAMTGDGGREGLDSIIWI